MDDLLFSERIKHVPKSFIREILKVTAETDIISFAGGLPNKELFPVNNLKLAAEKAFDIAGSTMLQYAPSEGHPPLRNYIAKSYRRRFDLEINPDNILILSGSQQGLDLLGKVFINDIDEIIIEEPGYLGAIQAFSMFRPKFNAIPLNNDGINVDRLKILLQTNNPKLFYTVPNFQNPSGISYSEEVRVQVANIIEGTKTYIVEDDPYGELRFSGTEKPSFANLIPEQTILLGSFSKTVVPGFRLGWLVAPNEIFEKLLIAKQAADLHTNNFAQNVLFNFLENNKLTDHIKKIKTAYSAQCNAMIQAIKKHFPANIGFTQPEGGMFLWVTLSENQSAIELFREAIKEKVAFVPGDPFYINKSNMNTLRLNFSCTPIDQIEEGIKRMAKAIQRVQQH